MLLPSLPAFAASVFLNSRFLGSTLGIPEFDQTTDVYEFPQGAVKVGEDNVVTVVQVRAEFSEFHSTGLNGYFD